MPRVRAWSYRVDTPVLALLQALTRMEAVLARLGGGVDRGLQAIRRTG